MNLITTVKFHPGLSPLLQDFPFPQGSPYPPPSLPLPLPLRLTPLQQVSQVLLCLLLLELQSLPQLP